MQARRYTVEILADEAWMIVREIEGEAEAKAEALAMVKGLEAEGRNVRLWSETIAADGGRA